MTLCLHHAKRMQRDTLAAVCPGKHAAATVPYESALSLSSSQTGYCDASCCVPAYKEGELQSKLQKFMFEMSAKIKLRWAV
eukprot:1036763-Pelagomonas_calceolata.AAC.1